jgi:hypothetical protein
VSFNLFIGVHPPSRCRLITGHIAESLFSAWCQHCAQPAPSRNPHNWFLWWEIARVANTVTVLTLCQVLTMSREAWSPVSDASSVSSSATSDSFSECDDEVEHLLSRHRLSQPPPIRCVITKKVSPPEEVLRPKANLQMDERRRFETYRELADLCRPFYAVGPLPTIGIAPAATNGGTDVITSLPAEDEPTRTAVTTPFPIAELPRLLSSSSSSASLGTSSSSSSCASSDVGWNEQRKRRRGVNDSEVLELDGSCLQDNTAVMESRRLHKQLRKEVRKILPSKQSHVSDHRQLVAALLAAAVTQGDSSG